MHERRVSSEPGAHAAMERALRVRVRDVRAACMISWRAGGLAKPLARVAVYPLTASTRSDHDVMMADACS